MGFRFFNWFKSTKGDKEKLNPAQSRIADDAGDTIVSNAPISYIEAYDKLEVVNRGVNYVVDSCAEISIDVGNRISDGITSVTIRPKKLNLLLNFIPNPYQSGDVFNRNIFLDLILEGNAFIYFDGIHLYNLPARQVEIHPDKKKFISHYTYQEDTEYAPEEIIHIQDNSAKSIFRGQSRLISAQNSINVLNSMIQFQKTFFSNGTVPGLVLKTTNNLSPKIKERIKREWAREYSPGKGGRRPMILDGDFTLESLGSEDLRELDYSNSITIHEESILKALGIPPLLFNSGNNANISPNLRLYYTSTVLPLVRKLVSAYERYFGYDLKAVTEDIFALRPDLRELGTYLSTLTNAAILTRNEAREEIRYPPSSEDFADTLILPANVAGSAIDPSTGGRPPNNEE